MEENNIRIIKNTAYLYVRQFIIMILGFLTTRIVLDKLGASDYGVNNVVAGFVSLFSMVNSILTMSTSRFLSLNLGTDDFELLRKTYSTALLIHVIAAFCVLILLESLGLWFLNTQLNIESERMGAANWIYQFSVATIIVNIINTPNTSSITSHEKFNIYAYLSIFDVVTKVVVLFALVYLPGDKLIIYGLLLLIVSLCGYLFQILYCYRTFKECRFSLVADKVILKEMMHFSGWSVIGTVLVVGNGQGLSILLNIFFNTLVNAARGLAITVTTTISNFVGGFVIAAQPQLVKYYGAGDMVNFEKLIFNITQYTLFLLAIFAVPVFMEIDYVLDVWLGGNVPKYTSEFIKITIVSSLIVNSYTMIDKAIVASGHVKQMALIGNTIPLIQLPLIYIVLKLGYSPVAAYIVTLIPQILGIIANLWISKKYIGFPSGMFFLHIIGKNCVLLCLSSLIPYIVHINMENSMLRFIVVCTLSVICTVVTFYAFALNSETRLMVKEKLVKKIMKVKC